MSWFGFGGGSGGDNNSSTPSASSGDPYDTGRAQWNDTTSSSYSAPSSYTPSAGNSFQEQIQLEAQKIEIQGLILQLTASAFDKCVSKPGSSLTHSESSCIEATVGKNIEARGLLLGKMTGSN